VVAHPDAVKRELANSVVRCHALDGNVEKALGVIHDMKANNVRRNHITYAPLFRLARKRKDVGLDMELRRVVREVEGGLLNKWIWIDAARVANVGLVFLRYNWLPISYFMLSCCGAATIHLLLVTGIL
jgi:pentatricopeptide repeat protein